MSPSAATSNSLNAFVIKPILSGQLTFRHTIGKLVSNFFNLCFREFCITILFAFGLSALVEHISDVVCLRSKEKVTGILTEAYIAGVTYAQTFWDWFAVGQLPGKNLGIIGILHTTAKLAVAVPVCPGSPKPTVVRTSDGHLHPVILCPRFPNRHTLVLARSWTTYFNFF